MQYNVIFGVLLVDTSRYFQKNDLYWGKIHLPTFKNFEIHLPKFRPPPPQIPLVSRVSCFKYSIFSFCRLYVLQPAPYRHFLNIFVDIGPAKTSEIIEKLMKFIWQVWCLRGNRCSCWMLTSNILTLRNNSSYSSMILGCLIHKS